MLRGFVAEYDHEGRLRRCARLPGRFQKANKGFEGLAHARHNGREYLYALREANSGSSGGRGRIDVYVRAANFAWQPSHRIALPAEARFKDYSALAYRHHQVAIVSQESARLWVGRLDAKTRTFIPGSGAVYRFPDKNYGNIEGIDWLSDDTLIAVSDRTTEGSARQVCPKGSEHPRVPHPGRLALAQDTRGGDACRMPRRQRTRDRADAGDHRHGERKDQGVEG